MKEKQDVYIIQKDYNTRLKKIIFALSGGYKGCYNYLQEFFYNRNADQFVVDELAEEFSDLFLLSTKKLKEKRISTELYLKMKQLDDYFSIISGKTNSHLWQLESIKTSKEWFHIKKLAKKCLIEIKKTNLE